MKASDLRKMIAEMVRKELEVQLPAVAQRMISEMFIRRIVAEQAGDRRQVRPAPSNLRELMQGDEDYTEDTPEPMDNHHRGIYHQNPMVKQNDDESRLSQLRENLRSKLLDNDNPYAAMYEGVRPVPVGKPVAVDPRFGDDGVPIDKLGKAMNIDFAAMARLAGATPAATTTPMSQTPSAKMRELEERRKALDVPASDFYTRGVQ